MLQDFSLTPKSLDRGPNFRYITARTPDANLHFLWLSVVTQEASSLGQHFGHHIFQHSDSV